MGTCTRQGRGVVADLNVTGGTPMCFRIQYRQIQILLLHASFFYAASIEEAGWTGEEHGGVG